MDINNAISILQKKKKVMGSVVLEDYTEKRVVQVQPSSIQYLFKPHFKTIPKTMSTYSYLAPLYSSFSDLSQL